jgi:hypothetical protein
MESPNPFTDRLIIEPKPQTVWDIPHAFWFTAMGIGGALYLNEVLFGIEMGHVLGMSLSHLISMILIGIGGLVLIADLGKPFRFLQALRNVRHSWITWGAICDFVFMTLDGLYVLPTFTWVNGAKPFAGLPTGPGTALGGLFTLIASVHRQRRSLCGHHLPRNGAGHLSCHPFLEHNADPSSVPGLFPRQRTESGVLCESGDRQRSAGSWGGLTHPALPTRHGRTFAGRHVWPRGVS